MRWMALATLILLGGCAQSEQERRAELAQSMQRIDSVCQKGNPAERDQCRNYATSLEIARLQAEEADRARRRQAAAQAFGNYTNQQAAAYSARAAQYHQPTQSICMPWGTGIKCNSY